MAWELNKRSRRAALLDFGSLSLGATVFLAQGCRENLSDAAVLGLGATPAVRRILPLAEISGLLNTYTNDLSPSVARLANQGISLRLPPIKEVHVRTVTSALPTDAGSFSLSSLIETIGGQFDPRFTTYSKSHANVFGGLKSKFFANENFRLMESGIARMLRVSDMNPTCTVEQAKSQFSPQFYAQLKAISVDIASAGSRGPEFGLVRIPSDVLSGREGGTDTVALNDLEIYVIMMVIMLVVVAYMVALLVAMAAMAIAAAAAAAGVAIPAAVVIFLAMAVVTLFGLFLSGLRPGGPSDVP